MAIRSEPKFAARGGLLQSGALPSELKRLIDWFDDVKRNLRDYLGGELGGVGGWRLRENAAMGVWVRVGGGWGLGWGGGGGGRVGR